MLGSAKSLAGLCSPPNSILDAPRLLCASESLVLRTLVGRCQSIHVKVALDDSFTLQLK